MNTDPESLRIKGNNWAAFDGPVLGKTLRDAADEIERLLAEVNALKYERDLVRAKLADLTPIGGKAAGPFSTEEMLTLCQQSTAEK